MDAAQAGIEEASSAVLREQIHTTQSELGEKIQTLEHEVEGIVRSATDSVRERIDSIRQVIDIPGRVQEHPVVWSAAALGVGVVIGRRLASRRGEGVFAQVRGRRRSILSKLLIPELSAITPAILWDGMTVLSKLLRKAGEEPR